MQLVSKSTTATLVWFTHDLRLHDNIVLNTVLEDIALRKQPLLCLYCIDPAWFEQDRFGVKSMGEHRLRFLVESLRDLDQSLRALGQQLVIAKGDPVEVISDLLARYPIGQVIASEQSGYNEAKQWSVLAEKHRHQHFIAKNNITLFTDPRSVFPNQQLPTSFSKFRTRIELSSLVEDLLGAALPMPQSLPPVLHVTLLAPHQYRLPVITPKKVMDDVGFSGGESAGVRHLTTYFSGNAPQSYKATRNALDGEGEAWSLSSKFSPWLANGSVSARYIVQVLKHYEQARGANDSTYWILFELLWREYFHWYAREHGHRLFMFKGLQTKAPLTSFYPQRFIQWCQGHTPWPLVNACMKQLNETGFLSNRGRQIVASCLVYELGLDWRCGAAYFEQQLIDYDVAANWGNWQYIAGVGADPRGGRHFNIAKQQQQYDPDGVYIQRWQGEPPAGVSVDRLDSVDAADWPIA